MDVSVSDLESVLFFADKGNNGLLSLEEFTHAIAAACIPDTSSPDKKADYTLKQRALIFPFSNPDM